MESFELLYAETHEWVGIVEENDLAYIGVSDFALQQMTDIVYLALPSVGDQITKGEIFGEIESVKAVSDLFAPIDGEVVEVNQTALDDPVTLIDNDDPWIIKVKVNNPDVSHLMSQGQYEDFNE
tara:strand:- start:3606 stop:3977 length:372 start_codon:yes stop_codon:yes gene_type:complete